MVYHKKNLFEGVARVFSLFYFFSFPVLINAQNIEVGGGVGGLSYTGDLNRGYNLLQNYPAATAFHRTNISDFVSFKTSITAGKLAGADEKTNIDPFTKQRKASFDLFLFEVSGVLEYHFLDWRSNRALVRWSPYVFGGAGIFSISAPQNKPKEYSNVQPVLPFGAGVKYILNPKWYLGFEVGARKVFFDYLDNVSQGNTKVKNYQYGDTNDNDMYYSIVFSINYSFYTIICLFPHK